MPSLHSPPVGTSVPSMSIRASSKNAAGCSAQTLQSRLVEHVEQRRGCAAAGSGGRNRRPWSGRECVARPGRRDTLRRCAAVRGLPGSAVAQRVVGQVQHVVALVIRQMNLQQVQPPVDGLGQVRARWTSSTHRADAAVGHAAACARPFRTGCCRAAAWAARSRSWLRLSSRRSMRLLAGGQLSAYLGVHSKSLRGCGVRCSSTNMKHRKNAEGFRFFRNSSRIHPREFA